MTTATSGTIDITVTYRNNSGNERASDTFTIPANGIGNYSEYSFSGQVSGGGSVQNADILIINNTNGSIYIDNICLGLNPEICGNGIDDDGDGDIDEYCYTLSDASASEGGVMTFTLSTTTAELLSSRTFNLIYVNLSTSDTDFIGPATVTIPGLATSQTFRSLQSMITG